MITCFLFCIITFKKVHGQGKVQRSAILDSRLVALWLGQYIQVIDLAAPLNYVITVRYNIL